MDQQCLALLKVDVISDPFGPLDLTDKEHMIAQHDLALRLPRSSHSASILCDAA